MHLHMEIILPWIFNSLKQGAQEKRDISIFKRLWLSNTLTSLFLFRAGKVAQWVKGLAVKLDKQSSTPATLVIEGCNNSQASIWPQTCLMARLQLIVSPQ